jgi:hypothetical protein
MANEKAGTTSTPVYVPYATLISSIDSLKRDGIPGTGKIDKTLWDNQSGAVQGQILLAYRFLGLIDEHNRVLPALVQFVNGTPEARKAQLREIVEARYHKVIALGLDTVTQGQLEECFRTFGVGGSTLTRAIRFFVKACQETGISISTRVAGKSHAAPAPTATTKRRRAANGSKHEDAGSNGGNSREHTSTWDEKLLEKFPAFDPAWNADLQAKWFDGFGRLMGAKSQ